MFGAKLVLWIGLGVGLAYGANYYVQENMETNRDVALRQFEDDDGVARKMRIDHVNRNTAYAGVFAVWAAVGLLLFWGDRSLRKGTIRYFPVIGLALASQGCMWRPYEPVQLETIGTNEEAFLIPLSGDTKKQANSGSEEFLKQNLVYAKQVRIPQQWVQTGYATWGDNPTNGKWQPAATLIKVDKSPVTRVWTADNTTGTSDKNEAVWVMTSDQVEFSTGWIITARIAARDDAVKFLHNYPNGSLIQVLDTEVRGKLQAVFGLAVTDLPMEELRKNATPYVLRTEKEVIDFFSKRGITITTLGIQGGFVYKDPSIQAKMVEVFNAEQERLMAKAATEAQRETNNKVQLAADAKAKALMTEKKAESDGIRLVADSKAYEIEKAAEQGATYVQLKRLDIEREKLQRWDGHFPTYFMGSGGNGLDLLLNIPAFATSK